MYTLQQAQSTPLYYMPTVAGGVAPDPSMGGGGGEAAAAALGSGAMGAAGGGGGLPSAYQVRFFWHDAKLPSTGMYGNAWVTPFASVTPFV